MSNPSSEITLTESEMTYEMYTGSSKQVENETTVTSQTTKYILYKDGKHRTISEEYINATPTTKSVLECFYENYLKEKNLIPISLSSSMYSLP